MSAKKFISASTVTDIPLFQKVLKRVENATVVDGNKKRARMEYVFSASIRSVNLTYKVMYIALDALMAESLFGLQDLQAVNLQMEELAAHDSELSGRAHWPWFFLDSGELGLKVKFPEESYVEALNIIGDNQAKATLKVKTSTYANFPLEGHYGISVKLVKPIDEVSFEQKA